ncbi:MULTISPECIES: DUF1381 domain-containing protein, partial [Staphylococcus]|nr:DUF1381 domain-containing protein [Staphylococcus aureus]MBU7360432.1 DUF1381 domain-containing protein [Staphylococcus aureus]MBU7416671.1 DUF1381 domain-containing protein [Staphylococcus aureus]MBU7416837.1 DUF1381 domain-containing protein [Staphylococcus aureus]MBU7422247.1 DUF1381 domain-containing protein [Staphylococcus aureus]
MTQYLVTTFKDSTG